MGAGGGGEYGCSPITAMKPPLKIQHEFDDESTFIVDSRDRTVAEMPPESREGLPAVLRLKIARLIVDAIEKSNQLQNEEEEQHVEDDSQRSSPGG